MFKNSGLSSDAQIRKETLEGVGYSFECISKKSGWRWSNDQGSQDGNIPSEAGSIQDAWRDAGERAQSKLSIPVETWDRMGTREQKDMIEDAISGE